MGWVGEDCCVIEDDGAKTMDHGRWTMVGRLCFWLCYSMLHILQEVVLPQRPRVRGGRKEFPIEISCPYCGWVCRKWRHLTEGRYKRNKIWSAGQVDKVKTA